MPLKIVMMGTGDFAVPTFRALLESPHQILGLYTQPDRPTVGRHKQHHPMRDLALEKGLSLFQPEKINTPEALAELEALGADLFFVAAYGQILSRKLLAMPRLGAINSHASLLPKYRGAAPINYAILKGETQTGVTIIDIIPQLDAGPMLGSAEIDILPDETAGELEVRLADLAPALGLRVIKEIESGRATRIPQNEAEVTFSPKMSKEMGLIDWTRSAQEIHNHIRAMQPWPTPVTFLYQPDKPPRRLVIRKVRVASEMKPSNLPPGTLCEVQKHTCFVQTADHPVELLEVQPEGKRVQTIDEFLRGNSLQVRDLLKPTT